MGLRKLKAAKKSHINLHMCDFFCTFAAVYEVNFKNLNTYVARRNII